MDNLKAQTHNVLTKLKQQISRQKQQDQKNKLPNPQNQPVPVTCKQLIDLYSHNLNSKQKLLLEVALTNELAVQMNTEQLKIKIGKTLQELNIDNNEFNIPQSEMPKALVSISAKNNNTNPIVKNKKSAHKKTEPTVQSNPEYFRVDQEVCHKLYQSYKSLPLGLPKNGAFNFQESDHHKNSMNYHKILQIFKDAKINIEINQKLLILRSIKKFCFNQNFISADQFIKVFKVIVHGLGFKQQVFQQFIRKKQMEKDTSNTLKNSKVSVMKHRKNYRFKTDNSLMDDRSSGNPTRNLHDLSIVENKKSVGGQKKVISNKKMALNEAINANPSYLVKAMENQKVSKITWQSLFNMKESSMHNFVVIPSFVRNVNVDQL